jgi:hypothetical protein
LRITGEGGPPDSRAAHHRWRRDRARSAGAPAHGLSGTASRTGPQARPDPWPILRSGEGASELCASWFNTGLLARAARNRSDAPAAIPPHPLPLCCIDASLWNRRNQYGATILSESGLRCVCSV